MYNDNLMIVGYDFGYNYNEYYVDRKNKSVSYPSNFNIARSINLSITFNDLGDYDVENVIVKTNNVVNGKVVTEYYPLKRVRIYTNYKCRKNTASGGSITKYVKPKVFYPSCNKVNVLCSSLRGAVVSSITVCAQDL
jgi:hypothetical protein